MNIASALKGIGGDYEINRLVGAIGALTYIIGAHAFEAWDVLARGRPFDLAAYCVAFPTGLTVVVGGIAGAVALKDRSVATARTIGANSNPEPQP